VRIEPLESRCVPTTITPTTFADGGLGSGSLRDAVLQFNADAGTQDDIIQLGAGTYALTIQNTNGHENDGFEGDLNLTQTSHRWIIQGAGPSTIIDASQLQDRVFQIVMPGTQVVFQDLVIQGGLAQDDGSEGALPGTTDALGGGILNNGGDVTLDKVVLENNMARGGNGADYTGKDGYDAQGGGLYTTGGALTLSHTVLATNQATGGKGGQGPVCVCDGGAGGAAKGGGLFAVGGLITLTGNSVAENLAAGGQGGAGGTTSVCGMSYCTLLGGLGGRGGAGQGGGLYISSGLLEISDSTIGHNEATGGKSGANEYVWGKEPVGGEGNGGGMYGSVDMVILTNSNISVNSVRGGDGGLGSGSFCGTWGGDGGASQGGGLYISGVLTVSNSTIASNTIVGGQGGNGCHGGNGGAGQGSGLWVAAGATAQLSFGTVATNQATGGMHGSGLGGNGIDGPATGGGVNNQGQLQTLDTIVARNTINGPGTNSGPDLAGQLGSLGHNLVGNSSGGSGFDATDLLDVDPLLGPLQNNGGPTETMALLPGSPAIDAGDNTGAPEWDQRGPGYPRIVNGIIDIGTFEVQNDSSGPAPSRVSRASVYPLAAPPSLLPPGMDHSAVLLSALSFTPAPIASEADAGTTSGRSDAEGSSADRTFVSRLENNAGLDTWWDHLEPGDLGPLFLSQPWKGGEKSVSAHFSVSGERKMNGHRFCVKLWDVTTATQAGKALVPIGEVPFP
jgi:hypothetical protein